MAGVFPENQLFLGDNLAIMAALLPADATFRAHHTTRERLVRAGSSPFAIFIAETKKEKEQTASAFTFQLSPNESASPALKSPLTGKLTLIGMAACSAAPLRLFYRSVQAKLPYLPLPESKPGRRICIRTVTCAGEQSQIRMK